MDCFCVCNGSTQLGDLLGVIRSMEHDVLPVLSIYRRIFLHLFIVCRLLLGILSALLYSTIRRSTMMIIKSRLRWFGHVERKDDNDWVNRCITWEVEGIRQRGRPKKTWWDCVKNDM